MTNELTNPDYLFEVSWEVCNKVGGIYTVLSSRAKTLQEEFGDKNVFIGPDLLSDHKNLDFVEDQKLLPRWKKAAAERGINCRIGRWNVPGNPVAVLVDFTPLFAEKDQIYADAWTKFGVDSIRAYGDYDEASMFSVCAGRAVEAWVKAGLVKGKVIYQAHEWMSGLGMLFLEDACPEVATVFTTHATSIGRSIAGNNKELYAYFSGYHGDQMAEELHMDAKHSIEKQSAHRADCLTTVSTFTEKQDTICQHRQAELFKNRRIVAAGNTRGKSSGVAGKGELTYHKIRSGENLGSIARRYGVSVANLKRWNGLTNNNITAGKRLKIYQ